VSAPDIPFLPTSQEHNTTASFKVIICNHCSRCQLILSLRNVTEQQGKQCKKGKSQCQGKMVVLNLKPRSPYSFCRTLVELVNLSSSFFPHSKHI
jgi:hypothetical protein